MIASVTGTAILGATKMEQTDRQQLLSLSAIAEVLYGILWTDREKEEAEEAVHGVYSGSLYVIG